MTSLMGKVKDDYIDYNAYCRSIKVTPLMMSDSESFYHTGEWKELQGIIHGTSSLTIPRECFERAQRDYLTDLIGGGGNQESIL